MAVDWWLIDLVVMREEERSFYYRCSYSRTSLASRLLSKNFPLTLTWRRLVEFMERERKRMRAERTKGAFFQVLPLAAPKEREEEKERKTGVGW